jgi:hypothetical protein
MLTSNTLYHSSTIIKKNSGLHIVDHNVDQESWVHSIQLNKPVTQLFEAKQAASFPCHFINNYIQACHTN